MLCKQSPLQSLIQSLKLQRKKQIEKQQKNANLKRLMLIRGLGIDDVDSKDSAVELLWSQLNDGTKQEVVQPQEIVDDEVTSDATSEDTDEEPEEPTPEPMPPPAPTLP